MKVLFACALLVAALAVDPVVSVQCGIGHPSSARRIVGGRMASAHAYPWIVYIQTEHVPTAEGQPTMYGSCDGSLIDDQWVLTASHCFTQIPNHQIRRVALVLGAHNLANKTENHYVVAPKHVSHHYQITFNLTKLFTDHTSSKS